MATIDDELNQLEKDIRQLKIEFEQYFGGGRKRPPAEIEWRIDQLMKRYADRGPQMTYPQRFRYNSLAQTYAKFREIFHKRLKRKEEGFVARHFGAAAKAIEADRTHRRGRRKTVPLFAVTCSDPEHEPKKVEQLYQAFFDAKQTAGETTARLTLEHFREFVRRKSKQLREEHGSKRVEYVVVVENGQVRLRARLRQ